jgi:hypothetical protein
VGCEGQAAHTPNIHPSKNTCYHSYPVSAAFHLGLVAPKISKSVGWSEFLKNVSKIVGQEEKI